MQDGGARGRRFQVGGDGGTQCRGEGMVGASASHAGTLCSEASCFFHPDQHQHPDVRKDGRIDQYGGG